MKLRMYSVRDKRMDVFLSPFFARHDVEAFRQISAAMKDPQLANTPMALKPADFELVCVGEFDDELGTILSRAHDAYPLDTLDAQLSS